jgi:hypothetical protein
LKIYQSRTLSARIRCDLKYTRHIEISVERQDVSILLPARNGILLHCQKCGTKAVMLPVETAAALTGTTPRMLYRWLEEEKLHFIEWPDGSVLLCAESFKALT